MDQFAERDTTEVTMTVKEFAEAASTQVRVANRYWLALLAVSVFVVSPQTSNGRVSLPLNLGDVDEHFFGLLGLLMVAALLVAFASAHAQVLRVQALVFRQLAKHPDLNTQQDPRDLFDALREPAVTRVAPLAQLALGKYQFFSDKARSPQWLKQVTGGYYLYLKALTVLAYLGFPAMALAFAAERYARSGDALEGWGWLAWPFVIGAAVALAQITWMEFRHIRKAWVNITHD